jgi:hypothetical protein
MLEVRGMLKGPSAEDKCIQEAHSRQVGKVVQSQVSVE